MFLVSRVPYSQVVEAQAFHPSIWEAEAGKQISEFKTRLLYKGEFQDSQGIQRNLENTIKEREVAEGKRVAEKSTLELSIFQDVSLTPPICRTAFFILPAPVHLSKRIHSFYSHFLAPYPDFPSYI